LLDVEIKFDEIGFKRHILRKPTYTGLLLNNYAIFLTASNLADNMLTETFQNYMF